MRPKVDSFALNALTSPGASPGRWEKTALVLLVLAPIRDRLRAMIHYIVTLYYILISRRLP